MLNMLKIIFKNLMTGPATRDYPRCRREPFSGTRGSIGIDGETCTYCGLCSKKCPSGAIDVDRKTKTWTLRPAECIICGFCVDSCPKKSLVMNETYCAPGKGLSIITVCKPSETESGEGDMKSA